MAKILGSPFARTLFADRRLPGMRSRSTGRARKYACPEDYAAIQGSDPQTVLMRGGSCIVGPLGQVLAGPDYGGERILSAELDMREIARGKYDFDVTGHYARPDVFRLFVNERAAASVVTIPEGDQDVFAQFPGREDPERGKGFQNSLTQKAPT